MRHDFKIWPKVLNPKQCWQTGDIISNEVQLGSLQVELKWSANLLYKVSSSDVCYSKFKSKPFGAKQRLRFSKEPFFSETTMSLGARMPNGFDLNLKFHKSIYFTIAAHSYLAALLGTAVQWLEQSCKKYQGKVVFKKN